MYFIALGHSLPIICKAASTNEKAVVLFFLRHCLKSMNRRLYSQQIFNVDEIGLFLGGEEEKHY